jgi:uncharacterized protein (TIGR02118 family)
MIRMSVFYPATEGQAFDHDYYVGSHLPLLREKLGDALTGLSAQKGTGDGLGGEPPFVAIAHLDFDSAEEFQAAFMPVAGDIAGDVANYTAIQPMMLMSDLIQA